MPFVDRLPSELENAEALITRRTKASQIKELWRSTYTDAYDYAMPTRETFNWKTAGQNKNSRLFDSTLQECTYTAANTMIATVFPPWMRWAELAPGGAIPKGNVPHEIVQGLQEATEIFFDFLHNSNFETVISETALDLMVGTGALQFDEGDDEQPFVFSSIPLSALELEEGPDGTVKTTWMLRRPKARDVVYMYDGLDEFDLPSSLQERIKNKPDEEVELIQGCVYDPKSKHTYGVVLESASKQIIWRYDYGFSSPHIVARATKVSGETYGRGRVLLALSDAKTLDKMVEFILKHAALQIAPPMTGVSDGVLNPYTAVLTPNVVLPVASNDNGNPSLRVLDMGGNFQLGDKLTMDLREKIRRTMLGPQRAPNSPVISASEALINDRELLWSRGGESGRIQVELLARIIARGVFILQKRGLIPEFKIDGREVTVKFTSPFAKSQATDDLMALERTLASLNILGPEMAAGTVQIGIKVEALPDWIARKTGLDMKLINSVAERDKLKKDAANAVAAAAQQAQENGTDVAGLAG